MEQQRPVNAVTSTDEWSQNLMKMYENWMDGDTFQGSYREEVVKEEEGIPTGQKQGGGDGAAFKTAIGDLPAIEFDKSTGLPTIPELGVKDETGKKDPKATSNGGEPPTNPNGLKPKYGAAIRDTTLVAREGKECCKKCGSMEHTTEECNATKEEIENYLWDEHARILTELSELNKTTYTVTGEKWENGEKPVIEEHHEKDKDGNVIPHEVKEDTEAAKSLRAKKVAKIMSYKK